MNKLRLNNNWCIDSILFLYSMLRNEIVRVFICLSLLVSFPAIVHSQECTGDDVVFTDLENVLVSGNLIEKDGPAPAGFASENTLQALQDGYLCFEFDYPQIFRKAVGLSNENLGANLGSIDFGFLLQPEGNDQFIVHQGVAASPFFAQEGDILKVERIGSQVFYYKNDEVVFLAEVDNNESLIVDGWFDHNFSTNNRISATEDGLFFEDLKVSFNVPNNDCSIQLNPSKPLFLCANDQRQVIATGAAYYKWIPSSGLSCTYCPDPIISTDYGAIANQYIVVGANSIIDLENSNYCGENLIMVNVLDDCDDPIIGCCFSNYGVFVTVNPGTYLNINCNLLNEVGLTGTTIDQGEFENDGDIRVLLDWINNGYNNLFITQNGVSELFGSYQKMRGNSPTHYYDLILSGNGTKEMRIDEYAHNLLDLKVNELNANDFTFFVENSSSGAIQGSSGFVSTDGVGYLSRQIIGANDYAYPLGSMQGQFRIRPIDLYNANLDGMYQIGYKNDDAANDGLVVIAPNVLSINNQYYHRIKAPSPLIDIGIRAYFSQLADGNFQSLAHWETIPSGTMTSPFWESTSAAVLPVSPPPGLFYLESYGSHDFDGEPFVLSQAGFYVNTEDFGNSSGGGGSSGPGVTITINPIGGSSSSGGGLGQTNGTGGTTTIGPFPLPGDYGIDITTSGSSQPGDITFTVGSDGTIDETSITYEDETTGASGELSPDLYDIDPDNNGIILIDTPPDLDFDCTSTISVQMGNSGPFVLEQGLGEDILINGVSTADISAMTLELLDQNQIVVGTFTPTVSSSINVSPGALSPGPYHFALEITPTTGSPTTIHGQFIVKP